MNIRYNNNRTVSVYSIPQELYDAINTILSGVQYSFDENEEGDFECDGVSVCCTLSQKQMKLLKEIEWQI